jgi:hypothetical protein
MSENQQQIESVNQHASDSVESFDVAVKAVWKRKSRAIVGKRYFVGMETKAGILTGWRRSPNPLNRHPTAKFICSQAKCGREAECRMDKFLDVNTSCGCLKDENVGKMIETVISSLPEPVQENIARELELGKRSKYSIGQLAVHFQLFGFCTGAHKQV